MTKRWENDSQVSGLCISRGKTYVFRYGLGGRGWNRSIQIGAVGEISRKRAREIALQFRGAVLQGDDPRVIQRDRKTAQTLRELYPIYMERWAKPRKRSWENDCSYFRLHLLQAPFANWRLADIDQATLWDWHAAHPKPVTANRCLETLSKAFSLAKRWGWLPRDHCNPCHGIEHHPEKARRRYASPDEVDRLLRELRRLKTLGGIHFRFACMVQLLMLTGARLNEIMSARWDDVDLARGLITPERHKTDKKEHREIVLGGDALRVVMELRQHETPGQWLIRGRGRNHLAEHHKPWTRAKQAAGITSQLWVHDLRHTFASYLLSSGQTLGVVGELLGHASTATTRRYAHLIDEERRRAVDVAAARLNQCATQGELPPCSSSGSNVLPFARPDGPSGYPAS